MKKKKKISDQTFSSGSDLSNRHDWRVQVKVHLFVVWFCDLGGARVQVWVTFLRAKHFKETHIKYTEDQIMLWKVRFFAKPITSFFFFLSWNLSKKPISAVPVCMKVSDVKI